MNREIKRVPLDFKWPLKTIWQGYINPYTGTPCPTCKQNKYLNFKKCVTCEGQGVLFKKKEYAEKYRFWEPYEPPIGEGYQIWEAMTGRVSLVPISKVFQNKTQLREWLQKEGYNEAATNLFILTSQGYSSVEYSNKLYVDVGREGKGVIPYEKL